MVISDPPPPTGGGTPWLPALGQVPRGGGLCGLDGIWMPYNGQKSGPCQNSGGQGIH